MTFDRSHSVSDLQILYLENGNNLFSNLMGSLEGLNEIKPFFSSQGSIPTVAISSEEVPKATLSTLHLLIH